MRSTLHTALRRVALVALLASSACSDEASARATEPAALTRHAASLAPPHVAYVPAQPFRSRTDPTKTIAPPSPAQETWRVLVNQHAPMQVETPRWRALPAGENVTVQMHRDSRFRCLVTPLAVQAETDDFGSELHAWLLSRELRCSSDGWQTWQAYKHQVRIQPDGTREALAVRALLREHMDQAAGTDARETLVLVRDDPEQREAIPGPPKVVATASSRDD